MIIMKEAHLTLYKKTYRLYSTPPAVSGKKKSVVFEHYASFAIRNRKRRSAELRARSIKYLYNNS